MVAKNVLAAASILALIPCSAAAQSIATLPSPPLPPASDNPMRIDFSTDPVLRFAEQRVDDESFRALVVRVVAASPANQGAEAQNNQLAAATSEARERAGPTVDATFQSYRIIARDFTSSGADNIVERTRLAQRTDTQLSIQQPLLDFGAGVARINSARSRQRAGVADADRVRGEVALQFIALWYEVAGSEALVGVIDAFIDRETAVRQATQDRIDMGAAPAVDMAQVDALFAEAKARRSQANRSLMTARARYLAYAGEPAPASLRRPPVPAVTTLDRESATAAALNSAPVRTAEALAQAARSEAYAARAETLPSASIGVEAGRYGVFERARDYDIRALFTLRARLFGGGGRPRADQARARAQSAEAQAAQARLDATSEIAIALADIDALQDQQSALEASYRAARISRDAVIARFVAQRGSVIEVARTEDGFVNAALAYLRGMGELDIARYALLARAGMLLDVLGIDDTSMGNDRAR